jgi:hypothetical protein
MYRPEIWNFTVHLSISHGIHCWQNDLHMLGNIFWVYFDFQSFWVHEWNHNFCIWNLFLVYLFCFSAFRLEKFI